MNIAEEMMERIRREAENKPPKPINDYTPKRYHCKPDNWQYDEQEEDNTDAGARLRNESIFNQ